MQLKDVKIAVDQGQPIDGLFLAIPFKQDADAIFFVNKMAASEGLRMAGGGYIFICSQVLTQEVIEIYP